MAGTIDSIRIGSAGTRPDIPPYSPDALPEHNARTINELLLEGGSKRIQSFLNAPGSWANARYGYLDQHGRYCLASSLREYLDAKPALRKRIDQFKLNYKTLLPASSCAKTRGTVRTAQQPNSQVKWLGIPNLKPGRPKRDFPWINANKLDQFLLRAEHKAVQSFLDQPGDWADVRYAHCSNGGRKHERGSLEQYLRARPELLSHLRQIGVTHPALETRTISKQVLRTYDRGGNGLGTVTVHTDPTEEDTSSTVQNENSASVPIPGSVTAALSGSGSAAPTHSAGVPQITIRTSPPDVTGIPAPPAQDEASPAAVAQDNANERNVHQARLVHSESPNSATPPVMALLLDDESGKSASMSPYIKTDEAAEVPPALNAGQMPNDRQRLQHSKATAEPGLKRECEVLPVSTTSTTLHQALIDAADDVLDPDVHETECLREIFRDLQDHIQIPLRLHNGKNSATYRFEISFEECRSIQNQLAAIAATQAHTFTLFSTHDNRWYVGTVERKAVARTTRGIRRFTNLFRRQPPEPAPSDNTLQYKFHIFRTADAGSLDNPAQYEDRKSGLRMELALALSEILDIAIDDVEIHTVALEIPCEQISSTPDLAAELKLQPSVANEDMLPPAESMPVILMIEDKRTYAPPSQTPFSSSCLLTAHMVRELHTDRKQYNGLKPREIIQAISEQWQKFQPDVRLQEWKGLRAMMSNTNRGRSRE
ncbi:MAG TPA: hypothetical protein VM512_15085 [Burkholderiaceae bacterium]|jgi:hypothetical protein|nr:hypothetical protein [Burkholderiaceae bacterium]